MVWIKRIWLACMLAIAAGGQVPLWLHQAVCHCADEPTFGCHASDLGNSTSQHLCTGHDHTGHDHTAQSKSVATDSRQFGLRGTHSDAEQCLACYALSQLSLAATGKPTLGWIEPCAAFIAASERHLSARAFLAYGSRAPPVA